MKNRKILFSMIFFMLPALWAGENQSPAPQEQPGVRPRKTGRALLELGLNLAISAANYWNDYAKFIEDWQFTLSWKDQRRKFFTSEGLRLDSNNMRLNWTHAVSGAIYYNWARTNNLSPFSSFLFSSGGSLFWEYFAEWREIASINDHIYTWAGGPAIGEPLFQIGDHFRSRPGFVNRVACLLFNPQLAVNDFLDGKNRAPRLPTQDWSDFRLIAGAMSGPTALSNDASAQTALGLAMRLVTLPGYGKAGSGSGYSRRPLDNEFYAAVQFNAQGVEEFSLRSRCVLSGWWWKNVRADEQGLAHGSEYWLGPVMAWDIYQKKPVAPYDGHSGDPTQKWFEREQPTRFTDKISSMHIIGPAFHLARFSGLLTLRLDLEATFDFSMIHALAYNRYSAGHDVWGVKTTLHNFGYYYAFGYSLAGRFDARYGMLRASAGVRYLSGGSIQGLDRYQSDVLDDAKLADSRLVYTAGLTASLPRSPLFIALNLEGSERRGRFHEISEKSSELRFYYQLGVSF